MEIIYENAVVPYDGTAVVLGDFDGLHTAHTAIIKNGTEYAKRHGLKSGVMLFEENTKSVLEHTNIELITENEEKIRLLDDMGLDFAYMVRFDHAFMRKTPEEFIRYLSDTLRAKAVFVGYDYKFGHMAAGNADTLSKLSEKYGLEAVILPEMKISGKTVSSTYIRSLIKDGRMEEAAEFLGREFSVSGKVEKGLQNGRKMGFPTANVAYSPKIVLPHTGVYAGFTYVRGKRYRSVINVGNNPTFGAEHITIESHILGFDSDIYNEYVRVSFVKRIRGDIKFKNMEELKEQIKKDVKTSESILI